MEGYRTKFEGIQSYFSPRFAEATKVGNEMIRTIEENLKTRKEEQQAKKCGFYDNTSNRELWLLA